MMETGIDFILGDYATNFAISADPITSTLFVIGQPSRQTHRSLHFALAQLPYVQ